MYILFMSGNYQIFSAFYDYASVTNKHTCDVMHKVKYKNIQM